MNSPTVDTSRTRTVPTFILVRGVLTQYGTLTVCRSYRFGAYGPNRCVIRKAGRAAIAPPMLFNRSMIEDLGCSVYSAPHVLESNPGEIALQEARRIWMSTKARCLVSIGTGNPPKLPGPYQQAKPPSFNQSAWLPSLVTTGPIRGLTAEKDIAQHCVNLALNSLVTHSRLLHSSISSDRERRFSYHRFNLDGVLNLEEWDKVGNVAFLTADYMREERRNSNLNKCVQDLIFGGPVEGAT